MPDKEKFFCSPLHPEQLLEPPSHLSSSYHDSFTRENKCRIMKLTTHLRLYIKRITLFSSFSGQYYYF
jgi:hypothetical protein